jgi:hypothetical protein
MTSCHSKRCIVANLDLLHSQQRIHMCVYRPFHLKPSFLFFLSLPQDHQQFLGRLRRDGRAIFTSLDTLRRATVGVGGPGAGGPSPASPRDCAFLLLQAAKDGTAAPQVRRPKTRIVRVLRCVPFHARARVISLCHMIISLNLLCYSVW